MVYSVRSSAALALVLALVGMSLVIATPVYADQACLDAIAANPASTTDELADCGLWLEASSTGLVTDTIDDLSSALYNILLIIIPVAVAVGIFFFGFNMVRGIFRNNR